MRYLFSHGINLSASENIEAKAFSALALEKNAIKAGDMKTVRQGIKKLDNDFTALKGEVIRQAT